MSCCNRVNENISGAHLDMEILALRHYISELFHSCSYPTSYLWLSWVRENFCTYVNVLTYVRNKPDLLNKSAVKRHQNSCS